MHTLFSRLPSQDPKDYVRRKLRRQEVAAKRSRDAEVQRAFSDTIRAIVAATSPPSVPIVGREDHPTPSPAQQAVIDERIRCAREELERDSPLAKGEQVEDDFFSYLAASYLELPAGTPVLRRRTDRAEMFYLFDSVRITDVAGVVTVTPPVFAASEVELPGALRLRAAFDTRSLVKNLASGVASGFGGQIGALIFDAIFPPGVPSYFDEIYEEIQKIVGKEVTQNTVDTINGELNATIRWLRQTYASLRTAEQPPSRESLFAKLVPHVNTINTKVLGPLLEKRFEEPGFSVFMIAAPVHLALLQEQALIDPDQPNAEKSAYANAIRKHGSAKGYAQIYADHGTRVLGQLVKARREKVKTIYNGEWITGTSAAGGYSKSGYSWKDQLTGDWGKRHSEYTKDKKYHNGSEEADRDRNVRRDSVEQALRSDIGLPSNAIANWRKLIDRPLPPH